MPDAVIKGFLPFGMSVLILAGLYYASAIIAPVTFAVFIIIIVWPLQSVLERAIPSLLALSSRSLSLSPPSAVSCCCFFGP